MHKIIFGILLLSLAACDNIKNPFAKEEVELPPVVEQLPPIENEPLELITTLDNLTVRNGDSLKAAFVTKVVKEGDTLMYLQQHSRERLNLKLRGKYFHEPWLKIETKSGKKGWVYGGGVRFVSERRAAEILKSASISAERMKPEQFESDVEPTDWAMAGFDDVFDFKTFLIHFKNWVENDEIDKIAQVLKFPVEPIYNRAFFKKNYEGIFDADLKNSIARQRLDQVFRKGKIAFFAEEKIWFSNTSDGYKIVAIPAYAKKVEDSQKVENYQLTFADLEATYQRPTKEANPPKIKIILKEKAISGEFIKYIGTSKESKILEDLEFKYSETDEKIFERRNNIEVLQRMTFKEKSGGIVELQFDDFENFGVGQKFILLPETSN